MNTWLYLAMCPSSHRLLSTHQSLKLFLKTRNFWFRKDANSLPRVSPCFSLRFRLTAGLAQKQLVERLKMPSVWFRFIFSPETVQSPDCSVHKPNRAVPFGFQTHTSTAGRRTAFRLPGGMWEWWGAQYLHPPDLAGFQYLVLLELALTLPLSPYI